MLRYVLKRFALLIPQVLGVILVVFSVVRLIPGNPARAQLGSYASEESIEKLNEFMGLDRPLWEQFVRYVWQVLQGDWGTSWFTGNLVLHDIAIRLPATLELVTLGMVLALLLGITLGTLTALPYRNWFLHIVDKFTLLYGLTAGAIPDFWFALILILVFFVYLNVAAPPSGRISPDISLETVTGLYIVDSILTGNIAALRSALAHLALPVATLVFVAGAAVTRMTRNSIQQVLESDFIWYARANGLPDRVIIKYALRNGLLPIITLVGVLYGILLAGAVLIEQIFNWNGVGQYAVQSVVRADYFPLQGVVLIIALFALVVFLLLDILYALLDPRIKY